MTAVAARDEGRGEGPPTTAVPMRTMEDAVAWDMPRADLEAGGAGRLGQDATEAVSYFAVGELAPVW